MIILWNHHISCPCDTPPFCSLNTFPDDNVQFIGYLQGICFSVVVGGSSSLVYSKHPACCCHAKSEHHKQKCCLWTGPLSLIALHMPSWEGQEKVSLHSTHCSSMSSNKRGVCSLNQSSELFRFHLALAGVVVTCSCACSQLSYHKFYSHFK